MSDQSVKETIVHSRNFTTVLIVPPEARAKDIVGRTLGTRGEVRLRPTDEKSYGARTYTLIVNNQHFDRLRKCMVGGEIAWRLPVTKAEFREWELTSNVWETFEEAKQALLWAVPMSMWGWDHWSTLAYLETCAVDHEGGISYRRMRCNPKLHPGLAHSTWEKEYPTQLKGGELLHDHDDWSCADDFEVHGLIVMEGTGLCPVVRFTDKGLHLAAALRAHKANGGSWDDFEPGGGRNEG